MTTPRRVALAALGTIVCLLLLDPIGADAQRSAVPKIRVIRTPSQRDTPYQAFLQGLKELGYVEGKTIQIEYCWGDPRQVATTVPIVFAVGGDPVRTSVAASLSRPGGNATGLAAQGSDLGGKRHRPPPRGGGRVNIG